MKLEWKDWTRRRWIAAASGVAGLSALEDMALAFDNAAAGVKRSGTPKAAAPRSKMKISGFRATQVASPDQALLNSWNVHPTYFSRTILQLETSDGFTGAAEVKGDTLAALNQARQKVLGRDPFEIEYFRRNISDLSAFGAIEVACLDLIGKAINRRVADLIGGAYREAASYSAYLFFVLPTSDGPGCITPEAMAAQYDDFHKKHGFKSVKFKGGVLDPDREVDALRIIRKRHPKAPLRIDPNAAWSVPTSIRIGKTLHELGLEYYEDPTPGFEGMAEVRRQTGHKLATNMIVMQQEHVAPAFRQGSIDIVLLDNHYMGGLGNCRHMAAICEALGWGCSGHSSNHLGVSMAAMTHMNCAISNATYEADSHYPWTSEDVIKGPKLAFVDGKLKLPDAPGLGVEVDENKLAALAANVPKIKSRHEDLKKWNPKHPSGAKGIRW